MATGVDFSEKAIEIACSTADDLGLDTRFICSDIYALPEVLHEQFDIVYTTGGVLIWLSDLVKWAEIVASYLKPGGFAYIRDGHPFRKMFLPVREDANGEGVFIGYFPKSEPVRFVEKGSYANNLSDEQNIACYYPHSLGEIITALCQSGLRIDFLHEFPKTVENMVSFEKTSSGDLNPILVKNVEIPHMYSIKCWKDK